jgi:hypothetical protein
MEQEPDRFSKKGYFWGEANYGVLVQQLANKKSRKAVAGTPSQQQSVSRVRLSLNGYVSQKGTGLPHGLNNSS